MNYVTVLATLKLLLALKKGTKKTISRMFADRY